MNNESIKELMNSYAIPSKVDFYVKSYATAKNVIGVPVPKINEIAKLILKNNFQNVFLNSYSFESHEEFLLKGIVIALSKNKLKNKIPYIKNYVSEIYDWSGCDFFCTNLKFEPDELKYALSFIREYKGSANEFQARFSYVILITNYVKKEYLNELIDFIKSCNSDAYYCEMSVAWLLCEMFIKLREDTLEFLINEKLSNSIYKKTIRKIRESNRVNDKDKELVKNINKEV